ncbi:glycosyltransferase [Thiocapsa marina]|uniref:Glycosyl transferase group 1 n=1 Tax=Thiocapsa marina 5811 TaxID=768671 RepID=F9UIJ7_9GAMM|nr:glycosyltransferase [Thiocapsa marina]EGV15979.1 glycosyl transferase group 1 [Thiocapsa marina 5811]
MSTRIIHVINGDLYSGAERVQDLLALRLPEQGFEVGFACVKPNKFPEARQAVDAPIHLLPMSSRFDLASGLRLSRIVKKHGYALLHSHTPRAALVGRVAAAFAGIPMVHHVHSPTARCTEDLGRNRLNSLIERLSVGGVRFLIPVSASLARYLREEGFSRERIRVVPNGVPTLGPLSERATPRDHWVIGTVALFRPRKGVEVLIEALALLRAGGRSVRLRAVGSFESADYESVIKGLARRLGVSDAIDWTGFTRDVESQLAQMDLFVLPSLYGEGMPMVILEAMAAGVPVVASDVEGVSEVLEHGRSGLVVPPNDPHTLAKTIAATMDGAFDWDAMRGAGWRRQSDLFSDQSMARGVAEVYREVLRFG